MCVFVCVYMCMCYKVKYGDIWINVIYKYIKFNSHVDIFIYVFKCVIVY